MSHDAKYDYLSIGGNRQSAASDYHATIGCLAYGADHNVAVWRPLSGDSRGVHRILQGHHNRVTAVAFARQGPIANETALISGAANGELVFWTLQDNGSTGSLRSRVNAHDGAVNTITTSSDCTYLATGGADASIKIWTLTGVDIVLASTIKLKPRLIPLALAIGVLPRTSPDEGFFIAAAGTRNDIQVYAVSSQGQNATLSCTLTGHEGWIRSLALKRSDNGCLLASTSADKYTRLWRFQPGEAETRRNGHTDRDIPGFEQTLTAKVKSVSIGEDKYSITFEALLLGHEDWVYTADWQECQEERLLTASADGTLAIWEPDPTSGIWVSETRLGEISGQKGATTATGSSGGFWTGKWIGHSTVVSLGRTGSWRKWQYDSGAMFWDLKPGVGGHTDSVNSLCWAPGGAYLLTTSADQTTRLHAEWRRNKQRTWHEFSRCQIHGYNCNVVECISSFQFVSGADEKLLRVFNEPNELADTLHRLCDIAPPTEVSLPESAAIPVLGLSNKEMGEPDDIIEAGPRKGDEDYAAARALAGISIKGISEPPTEDLLSRHTLWPEHEKLYGHGYEISEAAYGWGILATACKASSLDHATIRLYDPQKDWRQIEPPLTAHTLTVTRLAWSLYPDRWLLSVGRDRQWTLFQLEKDKKTFNLYQSMPKAHSRMILDAAFSGSGARPHFVTAGRDKTVKVWGHKSRYTEEANPPDEFGLFYTLTRPSAVTAVALTIDARELHAILAVGEEDGTLSIHIFNCEDKLQLERSIELDKDLCLAKAINRMSWRAGPAERDGVGTKLAVAGADGSVRILNLDIEAVCRSIDAKEGG